MRGSEERESGVAWSRHVGMADPRAETSSLSDKTEFTDRDYVRTRVARIRSPLHCVRIGRWLGARRIAFVFGLWCFWWTSVHDVRVCRGRFGDVSLRLLAAAEHVSALLHSCIAVVLCRARGLLYVLCWYVGVLPLKVGTGKWDPGSCGVRAISPAGRRFRASALVSGRKNHDVYACMCTVFLFAFPTLGLCCCMLGDCTIGISTVERSVEIVIVIAKCQSNVSNDFTLQIHTDSTVGFELHRIEQTTRFYIFYFRYRFHVRFDAIRVTL